METPDAELVRQAAAGERAAYGQLARRWFRRLLALCTARLSSFADAEDATQEALLRGYLELAQLQNNELFGPWMRTIATRVCADRLRAPRRQREVPIGSAADFHSHAGLRGNGVAFSAEPAEAREERARLMGLVAELPEEIREVLLLHYFEDMTYDELADWLGVARATVNERLARGREMLRRRLLPGRRACHDV